MKKHILTFCLLVYSVTMAIANVIPMHSSLFSLEWKETKTSEISVPEKLKGRIMTKEGSPIPYAIIAELIDIHCDNMIQCDSMGCFEITVSNHSTALVASAIGYLPRELQSSEFMGKANVDIQLEENPDYTLKEVEISAKRRTIVTTPTGLVYNMNDNPLKNNDAFEALKMVPMLTVQNEMITVVGRSSPVVYVNDRKLNLSGEALAVYLKALPADNIETINVIRTPDAKYKGANSVLSIKLKQREDEGLKGFLNGQVWKTHDFKETGSLTLDYAKSKWSNVFSVSAGNYRNYKEVEDETYYLKEGYAINRAGLEKSKAHTYQMNFMGVYQFSETKSLGVNIFGSLKDDDGGMNDLTHYRHTDQFITTLSDHIRKGKNITANINYQYRPKDRDNYLTADVDYLYDANKQNVINEMNHVDQQRNILSLYLKEWQIVPQNSTIYSARIEYGGKFGKDFAYDFGADAYYSAIRTSNEYLGWDNDRFTLDPEQSCDFDVDEFTPTLFFDLSKNWGKLYTSFGTRFEYTRYEGKEHRQNFSFKTNFFRVLPQMNLNYQIARKHSIGYSASYSLDRPSFDLLNPFIVRISPTEYSKGNPYLQPTKFFYENINYSFNNRHFFSLQHEFTNDMQNVIQHSVDGGVIENKPENVGKFHYIGVGYNTNLNYLNGRGSANISANYAWNSMKGKSEVGLLSYHYHSANVNLYNSFLLFPKQNIRFNLMGSYYSKQRTAYATYPHNLSFRTELSVNINDFSVALYYGGMAFLNDGKIETSRKIVITNDYLSTSKYTGGEAFQVGLRCSYNFGNSKVKHLQERSTSNSEVKRRVK
ncbi:outer membrane beta-barrel family protein [uncultured Parabacteroides sp.]|uniref:outer membrane beta-barrel family protein n=1 Tax=uncultured Parabacteroides sp. TaxID=512312 RepID=UPI00261509AA|nr:outer membrane beta-barrel family protein [uncultured Parabacteroides sp.]